MCVLNEREKERERERKKEEKKREEKREEERQQALPAESPVCPRCRGARQRAHVSCQREAGERQRRRDRQGLRGQPQGSTLQRDR